MSVFWSSKTPLTDGPPEDHFLTWRRATNSGRIPLLIVLTAKSCQPTTTVSPESRTELGALSHFGEGTRTYVCPTPYQDPYQAVSHPLPRLSRPFDNSDVAVQKVYGTWNIGCDSPAMLWAAQIPSRPWSSSSQDYFGRSNYHLEIIQKKTLSIVRIWRACHEELLSSTIWRCDCTVFLLRM